jgi:hypothetical protein
MTDDRKFWDAVWYIAEMPFHQHTDDAEYRIICNCRQLMKERVAEFRARVTQQEQRQ